VVDVSPFTAVVRNKIREDDEIVRRRWILVSGAFGRGKEISIGRRDEPVGTAFAICKVDKAIPR
jgi:hypothetical protein